MTDSKYVLKADSEEWTRLDDQHFGVKNYFGKSWLAPLEELEPKSILELGTGSGVWAAEVAEAFPEAEVLAVDINATTNTARLPKNAKYEQVDLTKSWPWAEASFDVIHARFVLIHLPNWKTYLTKAIATLKPGGIIIIEDSHHQFFALPGYELTPGIKAYYQAAAGLQAQRGLDNAAGAGYYNALRDSGEFSRVEVTEVRIPMTPYTSEPKLNAFGNSILESLDRAYGQAAVQLATVYPPFVALVENWKKEVHGMTNKYYIPYYFAWARKY